MMPANTKQAKELIGEYKKAKDATVEGIHIEDPTNMGLAATYGTPEATTLDARFSLLQQMTGAPPVVTISPNEEDFEILKRRGEAKKQLEFDDYITKRFKLNTPDADPYMFDKIKQEYPEYFQRRMEYIKEQDKIRQMELHARTMGTRDLKGVYYDYMKATDAAFRDRVEHSVDGLFGTDSAGARSAKLTAGLVGTWETWQQKLSSWLGVGGITNAQNTTNQHAAIVKTEP